MKNLIPFRYRIDAARYSESSKRSYGHEILSRKKYYQDIEYNCRACGKLDTYTAFEQKKAYENRHDYIHAQRVLCNNCWGSKRILSKQAREMERQYCLNKPVKLADRQFLQEWIGILIELRKYTHRFNQQRIRFIEKHLAKFS